MIDWHAHLAAEDFDVDRDAVRGRAEAAGVRALLVVGEDPDDNAPRCCGSFQRATAPVVKR
jgi:Tat protein secretion system quality control protein TatD with DNase activity